VDQHQQIQREAPPTPATTVEAPSTAAAIEVEATTAAAATEVEATLAAAATEVEVAPTEQLLQRRSQHQQQPKRWRQHQQ
jgi:hypothetical protein